ncbi:MAG: hypothetical protein ACE5K1_00030 [Acidiferrobacterales bacterium]
MNRKVIAILASVLLVHVAGCTITFYNATVIEPKPIRGVGQRQSSSLPCPALRLSLPDVDMTVCANPSDSPIDHGTILTIFAVLEPKAADMQFDPAQLRYEVQGEPPSRPRLVKRKAPDSYATVTGPVSLKERGHFNILFNAPQATEFTLFIEGISKSGQPVTVPPIEFEIRDVRRQQKSWTHHSW